MKTTLQENLVLKSVLQTLALKIPTPSPIYGHGTAGGGMDHFPPISRAVNIFKNFFAPVIEKLERVEIKPGPLRKATGWSNVLLASLLLVSLGSAMTSSRLLDDLRSPKKDYGSVLQTLRSMTPLERKKIIPSLLPLLREPDERTALKTAFVIGEIGPDAIVARPYLLERMKKEDSKILSARKAYAHAVSRVENNSLEKRLLDMESPDWQVRLVALSSFEHGVRMNEGDAAINSRTVVKALKDDHPDVRALAVTGAMSGPERFDVNNLSGGIDRLEPIDQGEILRVLPRTIGDKRKALPVVARYLKSSDSLVRHYAVEAIGGFGKDGKAAEKVLRQLWYLEQDNRSRAEIGAAIEKIGGRPPTTSWIDNLSLESIVTSLSAVFFLIGLGMFIGGILLLRKPGLRVLAWILIAMGSFRLVDALLSLVGIQLFK